MKRGILALLASLIFALSMLGKDIAKDTILVFYLGGQSNMDGYGNNAELPIDLNTEFSNVWIFHGNSANNEKLEGGLGKWELLRPGHGSGFSSNGKQNKLSEKFGVELSFAKRMQELYPNRKIAIIKYSRGGTSIDSLVNGWSGFWEPDYIGTHGINQYDHFLKTLKGAFDVQDINADGIDDYLLPKGIIWMQGESDGTTSEEIALRYFDNLKKLMDLMRASLRSDDLPVVVGKISDSWDHPSGKVWQYGELIQYAQEKYARTDKNAAIVRSTRYYGYSDRWHYDSKAYIDLGEKFAEAVHLLMIK